MNIKPSTTISFDKALVLDVLGAFDNNLDNDGYIIDNSSKERVLSPDGNQVHKSEFAGIAKGSKIFVKSDIASLIDLVEK